MRTTGPDPRINHTLGPIHYFRLYISAPCKNAPPKTVFPFYVGSIHLLLPHLITLPVKQTIFFRKVIVLITDAEQHYAMDGILGGIMNNFDTNSCKTTDGDLPTTPGNFVRRKLYTEEQNFDYPSFGEVIY